MKNASLAVCGAVALVLALPGFAFGQLPTEDSVVGSGSVDTTSSVSVNVRSGPFGENPTGSVTFTLNGALLTSRTVDCLVVNGRTATFAGTWLPNIPYGMTDFKIIVEDTGPTATAPDLLGMISTSNVPEGCFGPAGVNLPLVTGGFAVTDAQPFPTTKDQCEKGGWRTFLVFKNQGDCVSFVAAKGTNQPSGP